MLEIGAARIDITAYEPGLGMMGWGFPDNRAEGVAKPLHARAFVLRDPATDTRQAIVVAELCFVTQAVRMAVLDRLTAQHPELGLDDHRVLLSATHTHSGPGGTSHYVFYNTDSLGYSAQVFEKVVDGMVEAIVRADAAREPGRVRLRSGSIPPDQPVAFNRAWRAYNANPDVPFKAEGPHSAAALDRTMTLLRFEAADGRPLGSLNWFAVHPTSVHRDNTLLHPDNKGCAAAQLEAYGRQAFEREGFVAAFAQSACGDVSPNFRWHRRRKLMIGALDDDFESAEFNGAIQYRQARQLLEDDRAAELQPRLDGALLHADLGDVEIDAAFAGGETGLRTAPAQIGLRMIVGTVEGPGLPYRLAPLLEGASAVVRRVQKLRALLRGNGHTPAQANKLPLLDTGLGPRGRVFGLRSMAEIFPLPDRVDPFIAHLKAAHRAGALGDQPWTPQVLPVQVLIIDRLAIVALPAEFTTVAGRRIRHSLLQRLQARGVTRVVTSCYANAYAGYVTTPEEYDHQGYEGASTHFGRWTLGAYQTLADRVAQRLLLDPAERPIDTGIEPPRFDPAELERRRYGVLS